jgi:adenylate cyclase
MRNDAAGGPLRLGLTGRLWLSAALILLAIVTVTVVEGIVAAAAQRVNELETQNRAVVRATTNVLDDLQDAETGQRGYLLTNDPSYLAPYESARKRVTGDVTSMVAATTSPGAANLVRQLVPVVRDKLSELERTVALQRAGRHATAVAIALTGVGKSEMEQARGPR